MKIESLRKHLFDRTTRLYCVLDGASVPDLPMRLHEMKATSFCLFTGDLEPEVLYTAPFVVYLRPDEKFSSWVLENAPGNHWGIFVQSRRRIIEMRKHFRGLVNVYDEKGNPMIFRFYDPRVIRKFLPTCNGGELRTFFGSVDRYFAESEDGTQLTSFQLENGGLRNVDLQ